MPIKYKWVAQNIRDLIEKNIKGGIEKLPTEEALCTAYNVSRQTVRQALSLLEEQGLITRRQGSGSFVTGILPDPGKNTVGILISDDQNYLYPRLLNDMQTELTRAGFTHKIYVTKNRFHTERRILTELLYSPPPGIIAEGCKSALPNPNLDLYRRLIKKKSSIVFLHNYYPGLGGSLYVKDDNAGGSAMLVRHLAELGHMSIGGIFKSDDLQGIERFQGFAEAMCSLGLELCDEQIGWFDSRDQDALFRRDTRFLRRIAEETITACTAVVCYNDMIAYYLTEELKRAGYRLPEDLAVVSFDNTYLSSLEELTVTTLSHKPHEMGALAAHTMIQTLKGLPAAPQEVPWKLNRKESTGEMVR